MKKIARIILMVLGKEMNIDKKIKALGYKIDFWYDKGKLDAVCIAKWEGKDLNHKKTYKVNDIAEILLEDFLQEDKK